MQNDGSQSWIVISRGMNRYVTVFAEENGKSIHYASTAPNKDASTADLQSDRTHNLFSEESKQMIHNLGNVECFEFVRDLS